MLEHAAVPLLLDVLEILARHAVGRVLLAHVAETTGEFGEPLTIGALAEPPDPEMIRFQEDRTGNESYYRLCVVQRFIGVKGTTTEDYRPRAMGGSAFWLRASLLRSEPAGGRKLRGSADQRQAEAIVCSRSHHVVERGSRFFR